MLSGYYGFGNAGDEAVLSGILSSLSEALDGDITVLSSNPAYTLEHHNVSAVHRYKQLLPAVAGCDLLISGGGSLLQDATSKRSIYYYLAVLRLAQIMGKKDNDIRPGNRARKLKCRPQSHRQGYKQSRRGDRAGYGVRGTFEGNRRNERYYRGGGPGFAR